MLEVGHARGATLNNRVTNPASNMASTKITHHESASGEALAVYDRRRAYVDMAVFNSNLTLLSKLHSYPSVVEIAWYNASGSGA